jgi:KDO2-lipid IV(A) lauroyltransferase
LAKYLLFWFVVRILGRLPLPALYWIGDVVGGLGYRLFPGVRGAVLDNIRHAIPDAPRQKQEKVARQVFRNVCYYYADLVNIPHMDPQHFLDERMTYHGRELLEPVLESGSGAVLLSAHWGNPELAVQGLGALGIRTMAVTEPIQPPKLARLLNNTRSAHGIEFLPVGIAGVKRIIQMLRSGGTVALMGDRDIEGPKMLLAFLGEETWVPTGPIEVGLRTGVPIFPVFARRIRKSRLHAFIEEPLAIDRTGDLQADVRSGMIQYIARLEARLRDEPEQWAVLERIWDSPGASTSEPAVDNLAA